MSKTRQGPWCRLSTATLSLLMIGAISGGFVSAAFAQSAAGAAPAANGIGSNFELVFWQSIMASDDRAQYEAYLAQYPNGTFSGLARAKIVSLSKGEAPAPTQPAPIAVPAQITSTASAPKPATVGPASPGPALATFPALPDVPAPAPPPEAAAPTARVQVAAPASPPPAVPGAQPAVAVTVAAAPPAGVAATPPAEATGPSLLARLAAYSTQGATTPALAATSALPVRPELAAVPPIALPEQFCSAEERNRFHDAAYLPTVKIADSNNTAAITYLDRLQAQYDARVKDHDIAGANAIAKNAGTFRPLAEQAYAARSALLSLFDRMMAVPIKSCQPVK